MGLQNMQNHHTMNLVLSTDAKPRLKWTPELHHRFVEAVSYLGGADSLVAKTLPLYFSIFRFLLKWTLILCCFPVLYWAEATPKSLMRVLGIPGLTLYHLKSHLQAKFYVYNISFALILRYQSGGKSERMGR